MGLLDVVMRGVHVVLGVTWAGAIFFVVLFLEPSVRSAGPAGGPVMQALQRRRFAPIMLVLAGVTLLTGVWLYWRYITMSPTWIASRWGVTIAFGAVAGIAAFAVGFFVSRPTMARLSALVGAPPSPEQGPEVARLQRRLRLAARAVGVLLLLAILAMGLARHI